MKKRTNVDWSKHKLTIEENGATKIHKLQIPGSSMYKVVFINSNGVMSVTGDLGNWIFCREFVPQYTEQSVSEGYWAEKLSIASIQEPYEFCEESTDKAIQECLDNDGYGDGYKSYLRDCRRELEEGEFWYTSFAYNNLPDGYDYESIVIAKRLRPRLAFIFDAFEEICRRLKPNYSLGSEIEFNKVLEKVRRKGKTFYKENKVDKQKGFVAGIRTLREGWTEYDQDSDDSGNIVNYAIGFVANNHFKAYIVYTSAHRNPVLVKA